MRELVYTGFVSLDGVVDSPGGTSEGHRSGGWTFQDIEFRPEAYALKGEGGAIFLHGSAELARRLSEAGLIDRYHLLMYPVLLGAGKSLFSRGDNEKRMLKLRDSETYGNGIIKLIYDVV